MNTQTGLEESWHEHFKIPFVYQSGLDRIRLDSQPVAIHTVPLTMVPSLDFYAQLAPANELFVSLHGAATGAVRYPQFRRVESLRDRTDALLSFADPTLQFSDDSDFTLGWYSGGPDWDPLKDIAKIVREAQKETGAEWIVFVGSSAGGHAAMRIATEFPRSLAFVADPQSDVGSYYSGHRNRLFDICWPAWDQKDALAAHPERFNLHHLYKGRDPENFIYYRQSLGDEWHARVHARPFEEALATTTGAGAGRYSFVYEQGEREGHGKITAAEFDRNLESALYWWRESR